MIVNGIRVQINDPVVQLQDMTGNLFKKADTVLNNRRQFVLQCTEQPQYPLYHMASHVEIAGHRPEKS